MTTTHTFILCLAHLANASKAFNVWKCISYYDTSSLMLVLPSIKISPIVSSPGNLRVNQWYQPITAVRLDKVKRSCGEKKNASARCLNKQVARGTGILEFFNSFRHIAKDSRIPGSAVARLYNSTCSVITHRTIPHCSRSMPLYYVIVDIKCTT